MNGIITDVQRFCVHDGPGIRTTVFLKGCNLRCGWCHNPETMLPKPELQVIARNCITCGACLKACPRGAHRLVDGQRSFDRQVCVACGTCARGCYADALKVVGRPITARQVVAEVMEDWPFYVNSAGTVQYRGKALPGGMTLSGGEPLFQREFCIDVLRQCKQAGVHTAVETNLAWPWEDVESVLPYVDLMMADIKVMDSRLHAEWTGVPNCRVLENVRKLGQYDLPLIVRTPVIPDVNDHSSEIGKIADFIMGMPNLLYYELLPYHPLGLSKYASLGQECRVAEGKQLNQQKLRNLAMVARERGIPVRGDSNDSFC